MQPLCRLLVCEAVYTLTVPASKSQYVYVLQVIALQQNGQAIDQQRTAAHARREAKYKSMIANLLTLDCTCISAVNAFLDGPSIEE